MTLCKCSTPPICTCSQYLSWLNKQQHSNPIGKLVNRGVAVSCSYHSTHVTVVCFCMGKAHHDGSTPRPAVLAAFLTVELLELNKFIPDERSTGYLFGALINTILLRDFACNVKVVYDLVSLEGVKHPRASLHILPHFPPEVNRFTTELTSDLCIHYFCVLQRLFFCKSAYLQTHGVVLARDLVYTAKPATDLVLVQVFLTVSILHKAYLFS